MNKFFTLSAFAFTLCLLVWVFLQKPAAEPNISDRKQKQDEQAVERNNRDEWRQGFDKATLSQAMNSCPVKEGSGKEPAAPGGKTIWEESGFPERLQVVDVDMPLLFEGSISEELKQVILADIQLIYGKGVSYDRYDWSERKSNPSFDISGRNLLSSETINLRGGYAPKMVHEKFGHIVKVDGIDHVVIPKKLINVYEKAWEARKSDPDKYEDLEVFVGWLNTASLEQLKANNPFWLFGYDGISDSHPEEAAKVREALLLGNDRKYLRVRHPSILEFTYVDQGVLEKEGIEGQLPVGVTLGNGKFIDEDGVPYQEALFLYDGKKWYITFVPTGT